MKLKPIAKPVRIRIKSGGEEHSSLESLKQNFCLEDIKPLLDGRLTRWLQRLGEKEQLLADEVKNFDVQCLDQEQGMLAFLQLFFAQEFEAAHLHSLQEVACHWMKDPVYQRNGGYLLKSLVKPDMKWTDLSLAKAVYKQQMFPNFNWLTIFRTFLEQEDPELFYLYGRLFYEGEHGAQDEKEGCYYLEKAAGLGYEEAKTTLRSIQEKKDKEQREQERLEKELKEKQKQETERLQRMQLEQEKQKGRDLLPFLVNDLQRWRIGCIYEKYVTDEECERLQKLLKTKYQLEIPFNALTERRGGSRTIVDYVLSQYSE